MKAECAAGLRIGITAGYASMIAACGGPQSALAPGGREADEFATLFWVLTAGAVVLWSVMFGLFIYVARIKPRPISHRYGETLILGGGVVLPLLILVALLVWTLPLMPAQRTPGDGLTVRITGKQWWWHVEYLRDGETRAIVAANEIRLPRGRRTEIALHADQVIHSFWIPSLAGKTDMLPGRETRMAIEPNRAGIYRGQCAEFCGESHALMAFQAVVMEPDEFERWLDKESRPARQPSDDVAARGKTLFLTHGCGACHAVRGTQAAAKVGPDLTHVGGRESLAAGIMPVTAEAFTRWVRHAAAEKPGARMPSYRFLPDSDLQAIARYLEGLK